jgi:hypothetical protein
LGQSLAGILDRVAAGSFPPADGGVTILPAQPARRDAGVIAFTAHSVIFVDADPGWVATQLPPDSLSGPLTPAFLETLCAQTGRHAQSTDVLCLASPQTGAPALSLTPITPEISARHPRLARAHRYRDEVTAWQADGGVLILGRGVAGRWEVAVEVDPDRQGRGLGRALALAGRHLVPGGLPLWAQVSPGNVASLHAFLAAGYQPVGAEALLMAGPA